MISNSNKTQCVLFPTPNFNKRTESFQITTDCTVKHMEDKVKNLGVIFDILLSFPFKWNYISYLNKVKNTLDEKSMILGYLDTRDTPNKCSYLLSSKLLLFNMG